MQKSQDAHETQDDSRPLSLKGEMLPSWVPSLRDQNFPSRGTATYGFICLDYVLLAPTGITGADGHRTS
jgi:hypothetical protein